MVMGKKYEIGQKIIFQCYCNFSQNFCIPPGESLRSLAKRLWWKYCNIRWEEKLYFNAFTSNRSFSGKSISFAKSHVKFWRQMQSFLGNANGFARALEKFCEQMLSFSEEHNTFLREHETCKVCKWIPKHWNCITFMYYQFFPITMSPSWLHI